MRPPSSLPRTAYEVVHIYRKERLAEAQVRPVLIVALQPGKGRCMGTDADGRSFIAILDAFFASEVEAKAAAAIDMAGAR